MGRQTIEGGFAGRLERAIKHSGKSQRAIAEEVGLTEAQLSRYKSGDALPRVDNARKLAVACNVRYEWLAFERGAAPGEPMEKAERELYGMVLSGNISDEEAALLLAYRQCRDPSRQTVVDLATRLAQMDKDRPEPS